ncbi:hypothetical protein CSW98_15980 [Vibrio sp. HA2012]|uniref:hypothetical protein n=1 Tax=Vibrio sp. HA2012 TaxID=1971595 RepID=UPI000C2C81B3|nr:hypothetical protein [Vibrio sp. HA2012]PJC85325.1 hypothetical protein CSW98_15980 [Vibrio sp. HA2012]
MEGNTVLEQANEVLAEARKVLKKSEENLDKSIRASDLALSKTRELAHALSCLSKPMMTLAPMSEEEEHQLKEKLKSVSSRYQPVLMNGCVHGYVESPKERDVYDVIHAINVLALSNADVIQVFVDIDGNAKVVSVWAVDISTDWSDKEASKERLLSEMIYLRHEPNPLEKLILIESQLTDLIIEAREQAEAKAEVEA